MARKGFGFTFLLLQQVSVPQYKQTLAYAEGGGDSDIKIKLGRLVLNLVTVQNFVSVKYGSKLPKNDSYSFELNLTLNYLAQCNLLASPDKRIKIWT